MLERVKGEAHKRGGLLAVKGTKLPQLNNERASLVPQPTYALSHITDMLGLEGSGVPSGPVTTTPVGIARTLGVFAVMRMVGCACCLVGAVERGSTA